MKKAMYYILLVLCIGVFVYSAYRLGNYLHQKHRSEAVVADAAQYVTVSKGEAVEASEPTDRVRVDFEDLWKINGDVVAWLYGPDTPLNYPVVQADDNAYYLYRLLDGSWNNNGTPFLDCRNAPDFSDGNSVIYGHHMRSGDMFAYLVKYKEQSYYDAHPYFYLTTPTRNYRVDLFAGCVVEGDAEIYQGTEISPEYLSRCVESSTFRSDQEINMDGPILTLSTCSYEFDNARYVVLGALVPIS